MAAGLEQLLITNGLTAAGVLGTAWIATRGKRRDNAADVRVAEVNSEPTFAGELREALADIGKLQSSLAEERGKVQLLRFQLETATAENQKLAGEVEHLRTALEGSAVRLDDLNQQMTALSGAVARLIPAQSASAG